MCKFFSCVIDRNMKVWYDGNEDSHEKSIMFIKSKWKDNKLVDRDFVRIEIVPGKRFADLASWDFQVDEDKTLPYWFLEKKEACEAACRAELVKYMQECNIKEVGEFIDSLKKL